VGFYRLKTVRGRHQKRYSDNATLRFCVIAEASALRRIVIASCSYRSGIIEIINASHGYRSGLNGIVIASYSYR
jgi:hypothetical protein